MTVNFQDVQLAFCQAVRKPQNDLSTVVQGVAVDRMQVYQELLYNNVSNFIETVFPVARSLIDTEKWQALKRDFFANAHCESPFYLDISKQFLDYLQTNNVSELQHYPWLLELLHVEWMELHVELADFDWPETSVLLQASQLDQLATDQQISFSVPLWVLGYQWTVYEWRIGHKVDGELPAPSFLLVWRDCDDDRCQQVISPLYAFLIDVMQQQECFSISQLSQLLKSPIADLNYSDAEQIVSNVLSDLCQFGLLKIQ